MVLNSYAKLNLFLQVLNKRKDNYHNIKTIFERISLCDKIVISPRRDKLIKIRCNDPAVPEDESNLCFKSAKLLQEGLRKKEGLDIKITKYIPVGAGLGGGSSNAAAVLLGLDKLWKLNLSRKKLCDLAAKVGSDVPFFIYNTSFALGRGRGEKIKPLKALRKARLWHVVAVPDFKVSTPIIYRKWDKFSGLTKPRYDVKLLIFALRKGKTSLLAGALFNSLEAVTAKIYPEVKRIKEKFTESGVKLALMSGSGPAVFGIVTSRKKAVALSGKLKRKDRSWRVFVTSTTWR
jgi:4-diphosphocytidyl-2-C-methyl-D-erythritol kinase